MKSIKIGDTVYHSFIEFGMMVVQFDVTEMHVECCWIDGVDMMSDVFPVHQLSHDCEIRFRPVRNRDEEIFS